MAQKPRIVCSLLVLTAAFLLFSSCRDTRKFGTEAAAVSHFQSNRQQFDALASACEKSGLQSVTLAEARNTATESTPVRECIRLAEQLSVVQIDAVARKGKPEDQYLELALPGTSFAPYGFIFVPEGHTAALATVKSEIGPPPRVYRVMRQIGDRWFYFEYQ